MTSRTSEPNYWESHQLPQGQYHPQHYSYSSSAPLMINQQQQQQQQPRQTPMMNVMSGGTENPSSYSASPSNVYYGSFYQSTQMNGGGGAPAYSNFNGGHSTQPGSNGMSSTSLMPSPQNASGHLPSANLNGGGNYSMSNHPNGSTHHLNNTSLYSRSQSNELNGTMPQSMDEMGRHHHHNGSSQHSGSPTLEGSDYGHSMKPKRRQVKNACINCQKACKRCDEGRPCSRCVKYGLTDTCQDSSRKERKRGIKRGPYKRRATTGGSQSASSSTSHYPQSSFIVMDGIHSAPFVSHHPSHASMSPHLRSHRDEQQNGMGMNGGGDEMNGSDNNNNMINSPAYPSSAPGTIQRTSAPLIGHDGMPSSNGMYNRDHFHAMQPPRYTSRYDYERNGTNNMTSSPITSNYSGSSGRPGALSLPASAPPSSMSFSSSPASGYNSRSLFSPPALLPNNFLSANGHHRLHSDSSVNTLSTSSTSAGNSLSPRTPLSLSGGGGSSLIGDLGLMGTQSLSANSSSSSPGGGKMNGHGYIHHPGPTTTSNLPPAATGAFLNPPTAPTNNVQPFPLHIPHSARWRGNSTGNGDLHGRSRKGEEKDEQLAPMKLHGSNDSNLSNGTIRYQLPSPRNAIAKVDHLQDVMA